MSAFEVVVVGHGPVPRQLSAAAAGWKVHPVSTFTGALARCASSPALRVVLVVGDLELDSGVLDELPAFRVAHPGVPAVIGVGAGDASPRRLPMFARAGLDGLVLLDKSGAALRADLDQMLTTQLSAHQAERALTGIPPNLVLLYAWMLRATRLGITTGPCCEWLGVSESMIPQRARAANVMAVAEWLRFCRCLHVANLLDTTSLPLTLIARRLGFPSLAAMSMLIHRQIGRATRDLRESGGVAAVLRVMSERDHRAR